MDTPILAAPRAYPSVGFVKGLDILPIVYSIVSVMKNYIITALLTLASLASAGEVPDRLIDALAVVESNNNPSAVGDGGKALGVLQVWSVVVVDVNARYGTRYTHKDAFDPAKARDICRKYLSIYATEKRLGRKPTMEDYARIWNGGPNGHTKSKTDKYWAKVQRVLR